MGIWGRGWYSMDRKLQLYSMRTFQRPELQIVFTVNNKVQFSCSVVSDSLWPRGLQHARLPCPSPTPGACSNSCPSCLWLHPTILSSVIPFSSCRQSFPASGYFPVSQFFTSGGPSIGASASASVLPVNIQDWFPLGLTGLISSLSNGLSRLMLKLKLQYLGYLMQRADSWEKTLMLGKIEGKRRRGRQRMRYRRCNQWKA